MDLYGHFVSNEEGPWITAAAFKQRANLLLSTSYISLLLESLQKQDLVEADVGDHDTDIYTLTEKGVLAAERRIRDDGMTLDEFETEFRRRLNIGRIVSLEGEHEDLVKARQALEELKEHLKFDNDLGEISEEEKAVALGEVTELQETLSKPRVRINYLWTRAHEALVWIMKKGAGAIVGELAKTALRHIQAFINVFFN